MAERASMRGSSTRSTELKERDMRALLVLAVLGGKFFEKIFSFQVN